MEVSHNLLNIWIFEREYMMYDINIDNWSFEK